MSRTELVHASCVAIGDRAVLIRGASGTGKSALAMQLIGLGADLVADDQVHLVQRSGQVVASPPRALAGLIEARGLGLMRLDWRGDVPLALVVDLGLSNVVRLPQPQKTCITDAWLPLIAGQNRPNLAYEIVAGLRAGRDPLLQDPGDAIDADQC